jgi:hypothetical protein
MEAKELRIGNYVKDHLGRIQKVSETRSDAYICYLSNGTKLKYKLNTTKPIPLTEERLVKFGYNRDVEDIIRITYKKDDSFINNIITIMDGKFYFHSWFGNLEIKYVHKLQNLVFALTNEELTK